MKNVHAKFTGMFTVSLHQIPRA